jgi:hypothetical protein
VRRSWSLALFLTGWLVGWGVGEAFAIRELAFGAAGSGDLFLAAWLLAWTAGGLAAIFTWLWNLSGREIVAADASSLTIRREVLGIGRTREYQLAAVRDLRVERRSLVPSGRSSRGQSVVRHAGLGGGPIAFDYGYMTQHFGAGLDDPETQDIVDALRPRLPRSPDGNGSFRGWKSALGRDGSRSADSTSGAASR